MITRRWRLVMIRPDEKRCEIRTALNELTREAVLLEADIERDYLTFEKRSKDLKKRATKLVLELDELCDR